MSGRDAAPAPPQTPSAPDALDIVAPTDAVVTDVFAQPGIWAQPHQQLIALMPDAGSLEATAWFPERDGANIQPGQLCRVFVLELPGKSFSGKVEQVLPAGSLLPTLPHAVPTQARQIPVRIRFSVEDAGGYAELKSGMRAAVRVHKFTPPWVRIGALAEKMGGKR
jgi:multidrug resistance efflux pump